MRMRLVSDYLPNALNTEGRQRKDFVLYTLAVSLLWWKSVACFEYASCLPVVYL